MASELCNKDRIFNKTYFLYSEILDNSFLPKRSNFYCKSNFSGNLNGSAFYEDNPSF